MKREYKKTTILYILLAFTICFFFSTTAYSAINGTLTVKGEAYARREADVRITGFRLATSNKATSSYEEFGKNHIVTEVDLLDSSSYITYYVEITNYGSVDVGIFDITGLPSVVNYSIKDYNLHDKICDDTGKCNSFIKKTYEITLSTNSTYMGQVQLNFDFRTYHTVTYTDITNNEYPTEVIDGGTLNITFKEDLKRVQLLYNNREILFYKTVTNGQTITLSNITKDIEVKIKEQAARLVNGSINTVGSEICIGEECFYIISNDGSTVKMLSKYNLYVGNQCNDGRTTIALTNPTGKQSSSAEGHDFAKFPSIATINFSENNYWYSGGLKANYGANYPAYIYDSNSVTYNYTKSYEDYLISLGARDIEARLITYEELYALGCDWENYTCIDAPKWVYSTSYWSGSAYDDVSVYVVLRNVNQLNNYLPTYKAYFGVRPVIEIDVDEIYVQSGARLVNGSLDTIGSEVCIDEECFYIFKNDGTNVSMISKYNLHIGNTYDGTVVPLANPTGIQNEKAIGWFSGRSKTNPIIGNIGFYSYGNIYWSSSVTNYPAYVFNANSPIYSHLQNYKNILINKGANVSNIRLIQVNELVNLGCNISTSSCTSSQYPWLYSTSYWTGSAASSTNVYHVISNGNLNSSITFTDFNAGSDTLAAETAHEILAGARPVIEIPVSEIH